MAKIKMILEKIKYYRVISLSLCLLLFAAGIILKVIIAAGASKYEDQTVAKRWDFDGRFAQVSIFIKESDGVTSDNISQMNYEIEKKLSVNAAENEIENARSFIECYSAKTEEYLTSEKKSVNVSAIAVGGDFFYFHPVKLLSGTYFTSEDLMHDGIILDEETAWHLFGSYDVVGQQIEMNGKVVFVKGVYQKANNKIYNYARGSKDEIFVPYELVSNEGVGPSITCIEVCMPNLVDNFASGVVTECFRMPEGDMIIRENSNRYTVENLWSVYKARRYRAMDNSDIILPYWEKIARYEEDVLAPKAVWMCVCFISAGTILVCLVMYELTILTRFKKFVDDV